MATYIGIDIGKKTLQVYLPATDRSWNVINNESGFVEIIKHLRIHNNNLADIIIVFEPTGGYEQPLRAFLQAEEISFVLVHPNKVRSYAKAKGLLAKTDKIDSKLLSDYAYNFSLEATYCFKEGNQQKLHALIKRREQLILFKNQEVARLDKTNEPILQQSLHKHISYLEQELKAIEQQIEVLCYSDSGIKDKIASLTSIPGVGITLATTVICELPELGNYPLEKLTSLVGLAPFARDSGQYRGRRSIFAGRGNLRKVLYMASVASLRCNKRLKAFYDHLIDKHKPAKVALVAVMRKLLSYMHAIIKNNSLWHLSYTKS